MQANAAVNSLKPRFAVEAHLEHLFALASTAEPNSESDGLHDDGSLSDAVLQGTTERSLPEGQSVPREQEESPLPRQLHPTLDAGVYEELTRVNSERHEWIEREGEPNRAITRGHYQRLADFQVSTTDPDATVMQTKGGGAHLGYHTHYIVDGGKARIILAALVTPKARAGKSAGARSRLPNAFSLEVASPPIRPSPRASGTAETIVALEEQQIRAYVPLPDFDKRTECFGQRDFRYSAERDVYICPNEAELHLLPSGCTDQYLQYRAKASVCNACPLKAQCTTSNTGRKLSRHVAEGYFERVRSYHTTEPYKKAMRKRSVWVEPLFARAEKNGME